jgi:hypothetical protein
MLLFFCKVNNLSQGAAGRVYNPPLPGLFLFTAAYFMVNSSMTAPIFESNFQGARIQEFLIGWTGTRPTPAHIYRG